MSHTDIYIFYINPNHNPIPNSIVRETRGYNHYFTKSIVSATKIEQIEE
jgi:hypothetical protein